MKFYEKYYKNNYEELITYYPHFYRDVWEMVEILKANGGVFDTLEANIEQTYLNNFIDCADEATISKLEKFLMIGLNKNRTLEECRRLVKSYFVGSGKMSESKIKEIIKIFTQNTVRVDFPTDRLQVNIDLQDIDTIYLKDIRTVLKKRIPAHLDMAVIGDIFLQLKQSITYNTKLIIKNEFFPRANIAYLSYNTSAKYNGDYKYNKYKSSERIELYPIQLNLKSEILSRAIFLPEIQMKNVFKTLIHTETRLKYRKDTENDIEIERELGIKKDILVLPRYEIKLKIGKHPNRYDGIVRYNGAKQYYVEKEEII